MILYFLYVTTLSKLVIVDSINVSAAVAEVDAFASNPVLMVVNAEGEGATNANPVAIPIVGKLVL